MAERLTRFSVAPLATLTRQLANVASGRLPADLVISGARTLSTYSERIGSDRENLAQRRPDCGDPSGGHLRNM